MLTIKMQKKQQFRYDNNEQDKTPNNCVMKPEVPDRINGTCIAE